MTGKTTTCQPQENNNKNHKNHKWTEAISGMSRIIGYKHYSMPRWNHLKQYQG